MVKEILDNPLMEAHDGFLVARFDVENHGTQSWSSDYGRGIPLEKSLTAYPRLNTDGKFIAGAFSKICWIERGRYQAVNALFGLFKVQAYREGETQKWADLNKGILTNDAPIGNSDRKWFTKITFSPDGEF